jgi:hypothetical protein
MILHKFKIGQSVHFAAGLQHAANARGYYEIVRLLPSDRVENQYRIKSSKDGHERVVRESELS